jgi:hypothetical protein
MIVRLFLVLALSLSLGACGTKNNLITPDGKETAKGQKDPSRPPHPIGQ